MPKVPKKPVIEWGTSYMGIDPGKKGAIAVLYGSTKQLFKMPVTESDIWAIFKSWHNDDGNDTHTIALIEHVHSFSGQGVKSMFTFGLGYGGLLIAMTAAGIPFEMVQSKEWQKHFGIVYTKKAGAAKVDRNKVRKELKHKAMIKAQRLYPGLDGITAETADALLIATYHQRKNEGRL